MKPKFAREIALLTLPILLIGAVALWQKRDDAPEDLWSGKARIVNQVRVTEATPLERYRGYSHRIEIDQWAAGNLPLQPPPRAGALKSYRWFSLGMPELQVAFRQGKIWKRTLTCDEISSWEDKKQLKASQVAPEIASLWVAMGGTGDGEREMARLTCLLRLPEAPRVEEAVLIGRTEGELEDRDDRMIGGVKEGDIVKQHKLFSDKMRVPLELGSGASGVQIVREPGWEVRHVTVMSPAASAWSQMSVDLQLKRVAQDAEAGRPKLVKSRLLDANGQSVAQTRSYGFGQKAYLVGDQAVTVDFGITPKLWKKLVRPLTFQTILSVNDAWPIEVNVELGRDGAVLPPKNSKLPFVREPLPLR